MWRWLNRTVIEARKRMLSKLSRSHGACSVECHLKEDLTLEDRIYICDCGNVIDRDLNASINLEKYGLIKLNNTDSLSGIKACGESVRLQDACIDQEAVSMKQEENIKCSI